MPEHDHDGVELNVFLYRVRAVDDLGRYRTVWVRITTNADHLHREDVQEAAVHRLDRIPGPDPAERRWTFLTVEHFHHDALPDAA